MATRLNKQHLAEDLALQVDVGSKAAALRIIDHLVEKIKDELTNGNEVSISTFGKFEPFTRSNGQVTPKFRPFTDFKSVVKA